jgi:hypothetical protein
MALKQLIYVSTASVDHEMEALLAILESSLRHNKPQEVTGILLFAEGCFMQALEGEEHAVDETMARIREDSRHHSIYVIDSGAIERREFGDWTMAFRQLNESDRVREAYVPFDEFRETLARRARDAGTAHHLLATFAESYR